MNLKHFLIGIIVFLIICSFGRLHRPKENFTDITKTESFRGHLHKEGQIACILSPYDKEHGYIGTFYKKGMTDSNNLIQTYSIKDNKWYSDPLDNGAIDPITVIIDLTWSHDILNNEGVPSKKLMAVGMKMGDKGEYEYKTYIKKTSDIESEWEPLFKNSDIDKSIICIRYDLNDNLIGISNHDYQLYTFIPNDSDTYGKWEGPINFSEVKLNKLLFSKEKKLLGIDIHGKLHCKESFNWKQSEWIKDKNKPPPPANNARLFDCIYDIDGKLIGTTNNGLIKQNFNTWFSDFTEYCMKNGNVHIQPKDIELSNSLIITYRTGNDTSKFDYIPIPIYNPSSNDQSFWTPEDTAMDKKIQLIKSLNEYLNLKRKLIHNCNKNRHYYNDNIIPDIHDVTELYNTQMGTISTLISKLESKGYSL